MGKILGRALLAGLAGFLVVPLLVFAIVVGLGHVLDPRCTAGCDTGAGAIALASAVPAFSLLLLVGLVIGLRHRRRTEAASFTDALDQVESASRDGG